MTDPQTVLGIPVPKCARELAGVTPPYPSHPGDSVAPELITAYGKKHFKGPRQILYETQLSFGLSDIVIMLERPYVKNYHTSFDMIVQGSDTLRAVDELIQFSSCGARSIHTVTVINSCSLQPDKKDKHLDEACHELVAQLLQAKRPKIILRCDKNSFSDGWMSRFNFHPPNFDLAYRFETHEVRFDETHTATVFQSYHPSCAVHKTEYRPEYRALLIHHFLAAFGALRGQELPDYVECIRQRCLEHERKRFRPVFNSWAAAEDIRKAICGKKGARRVYKDEPPIMDRVNVVYQMYSTLQALAQSNLKPGALALAKVITFLWQKHFITEPLFDQVMFLLKIQGNSQPNWIEPPAPQQLSAPLTPVTQDFAQLDLTEKPAIDDTYAELEEEFNSVISNTRQYLFRSSVMELMTTLDVASSLRYCEIIGDFPAGKNLEFVLTSSQFQRLVDFNAKLKLEDSVQSHGSPCHLGKDVRAMKQCQQQSSP